MESVINHVNRNLANDRLNAPLTPHILMLQTVSDNPSNNPKVDLSSQSIPSLRDPSPVVKSSLATRAPTGSEFFTVMLSLSYILKSVIVTTIFARFDRFHQVMVSAGGISTWTLCRANGNCGGSCGTSVPLAGGLVGTRSPVTVGGRTWILQNENSGVGAKEDSNTRSCAGARDKEPP